MGNELKGVIYERLWKVHLRLVRTFTNYGSEIIAFAWKAAASSSFTYEVGERGAYFGGISMNAYFYHIFFFFREFLVSKCRGRRYETTDEQAASILLSRYSQRNMKLV